jgi:hypothetical protein
MAGDRFSYQLDSTLDTVDSAEQTASRIASERLRDDEVMQIAMAVREAVNAVLHGNAYDPEEIDLEFGRTPKAPGDHHPRPGQRHGYGEIPDGWRQNLGASGGDFLNTLFYGFGGDHPSIGHRNQTFKHVHGPSEGGKEASQ